MSDIAWGTHVRGMDRPIAVDSAFFQGMIEEIDPDVMIFAGDSIRDRCSRNRAGDLQQFLAVLRYLDRSDRFGVIVQGNNDDRAGEYGAILRAAEDSPCIYEISSRRKTVGGIRFLGVPYGRERQIARSGGSGVDMLVAHTPLSRRAWLFDLGARLVLCGHYDNRVTDVGETAFVSLDCSPFSYAVIDWQKEGIRIGYHCRLRGSVCDIAVERGSRRRTAHTCDPEIYRQLTAGRGSVPYGARMEVLREAKRRLPDLDRDGRIDLLRRLVEAGIPRTHIEQYIGRARVQGAYLRQPFHS